MHVSGTVTRSDELELESRDVPEKEVLTEAEIGAVRSSGTLLRLRWIDMRGTMVGTEHETVVCCFCDKALMRSRAAIIVVRPPNSEEGESQELFCHGRCLVQAVSKRVPLHPELTEAASQTGLE
jgi:hypothetical protein